MNRHVLISGAIKAGMRTLFDHPAALPAFARSDPKEVRILVFDASVHQRPLIETFVSSLRRWRDRNGFDVEGAWGSNL